MACPFPFRFQAPVIEADFDFVLAYLPDWVPLRQEKRFRFGMAKDRDGKLIWLPRSISE